MDALDNFMLMDERKDFSDRPLFLKLVYPSCMKPF